MQNIGRTKSQTHSIASVELVGELFGALQTSGMTDVRRDNIIAMVRRY